MKRPGWGGYILRTCERKKETERAEVARGGRRQGGWPWDGQGWGERFERASKWVVHLSQLAEIYFIPRLNLSSVVSLDQATACLDIRVSVYIYIYSIHAAQLSSHVVYSTDCTVEIKMLFNTDANRCPVFYASLSAGYTRLEVGGVPERRSYCRA